MNPQETIVVDGVSYPIVFSTNASYQLEKYLYKEGMGTVGDIFKRLIDGRAGMIEVHQILWAALEGGRTRDVVPTRPNPFTVEEVGRMIDKMGGLIALAAIKMAIINAITAAAPESGDEGVTKAVAEAVIPNAPAGSGNGKHSSHKRQKSGSTRRRSGG